MTLPTRPLNQPAPTARPAAPLPVADDPGPAYPPPPAGAGLPRSPDQLRHLLRSAWVVRSRPHVPAFLTWDGESRFAAVYTLNGIWVDWVHLPALDDRAGFPCMVQAEDTMDTWLAAQPTATPASLRASLREDLVTA